MSKRTSISDITEYLVRVKKLLSEGKYDFVPRRKNMQALARHGLTIMDVKSEILELVSDDYYKGMQFYVKVKIVRENGEDILKCLGFHEDDFS